MNATSPITDASGSNDVIDWLMQGDPAIRWQTMRDLLDEPPARWQRERRRVAGSGWGKQLLELQDPAGTWGGGFYTPKWTSTNYTLLLLRDMGLPRDNRAAAAGARMLAELRTGRVRGQAEDKPGPAAFEKRLGELDLCVTGMYLALLSYFDVRDERTGRLVEHLLAEQMADGGWNCAARRHPCRHSSLHTTINVLDGLTDYARYRPGKADAPIAAAVDRALEFILAHRLFRSDRTGEVALGRAARAGASPEPGRPPRRADPRRHRPAGIQTARRWPLEA